MTVADTWEADPLILGRDTEWQVTLARGNDGAWRFDRETVSRVPDLFDRLTPEEKSAREHRSNFHSAQQTMRTLLHASDAGDLDLAARCLDLDGVPQGARRRAGADPGLQAQVRPGPDRPGRPGGDPVRGRRPPVLLPPQHPGPHRPGEARRRDPPRRLAVFARDRCPDRGDVSRRVRPSPRPGPLAGQGRPRGLSPRLVPSLWLRGRLPAWLRGPGPGLEVYQWIGLAIALAGCGIASWLGLRVLERVAAMPFAGADSSSIGPWSPPSCGPWLSSSACGASTSRSGCSICLRPSSASTIPAIKIAWIGLMGWTAFRLIDLGLILYGRSERLHDRRSLSDMIVPTAANGLKLSALFGPPPVRSISSAAVRRSRSSWPGSA